MHDTPQSGWIPLSFSFSVPVARRNGLAHGMDFILSGEVMALFGSFLCLSESWSSLSLFSLFPQEDVWWQNKHVEVFIHRRERVSSGRPGRREALLFLFG